jgi:hypothetical protein
MEVYNSGLDGSRFGSRFGGFWSGLVGFSRFGEEESSGIYGKSRFVLQKTQLVSLGVGRFGVGEGEVGFCGGVGGGWQSWVHAILYCMRRGWGIVGVDVGVYGPRVCFHGVRKR